MKRIKRVLLGGIFLYILLFVIDILITKKLMQTNLFDGEYEDWRAINNKEIGNDLYLYGSSRTYVHLNPSILDKELKINSYNLGFNGQRMEFLKYRNDKILEKGNIPKNVVLNLDIVTLEDRYIYNQEQYYPLLFFDYDLYTRIKDDISVDLIDIYIPLIRYFRYRKYTKKYIKILLNIMKGEINLRELKVLLQEIIHGKTKYLKMKK